MSLSVTTLRDALDGWDMSLGAINEIGARRTRRRPVQAPPEPHRRLPAAIEGWKCLLRRRK